MSRRILRPIPWISMCLVLATGAGVAQTIPDEVEENLGKAVTALPAQPYAISSVRVSAGGSAVQGVEDGQIYAPPLSDKCWPTELPTRGAFAGTLAKPVTLEVSIKGCGPEVTPPPKPPLLQHGQRIKKLPIPKPPGVEPEVACSWTLNPYTANDPSCRQLDVPALTGAVSWTGWQGEIPLPAMTTTGAYRLDLSCDLDGLPNQPPVWTDFFVTYNEPLAVFSPPETDWYSKATCWASGLGTDNSEEDVLEAILSGIYAYGQHNWLYGYANQGKTENSYSFPVSANDAGTRTVEYVIEDEAFEPKCTTRCKCYWQGLVAPQSPCNFGDCYVFSDVLQAISGVMGVGGLRYVAITGEAGDGFLTHRAESLDPKFAASVGCVDNDESCYPYLFSSHSLRGRDARFYDSTFKGIYDRPDQSVALSKQYSKDKLVTFLDSKRVLYSRGSQYGSWAFYETLPNAFRLSLPKPAEYARFTGDITFTKKDSSQDGIYDYLVAEVGIEIVVPGAYVIHGSLTKGDTVIAHQPSYWSSQPTTALVSGKPGVYTATLYLSGQEIYQSGQDGPYEFSIMTHGDDFKLKRETVETPAFQYREFGELEVAIDDGTSVTAVDSNGNGAFDHLSITVPISVRAATGWALGARLAKGGTTIGYAGVKKQTDAGSYSIDLEISGKNIARHRLDGPWELTLVHYNDRLMALTDVQLEVDGHPARRFE